MSADRVARLEQVRGWVWKHFQAAWETGVSALERYVAREHSARVPSDHTEDGYPLGTWVTDQRSAYRARRLSPDRTARLEAFQGWAWNTFDAKWEAGFSTLESYVAREKHALVPRDHAEDSYRLGAWVNIQRANYRTSRLAPERAARLEALRGWVWNPFEADWEEGFSTLQRYLAREHHARVPVSHTEDSYPLGSWVNSQRKRYRAGRLSIERSGRLEALSGWAWNPGKQT